MYIPPKFRLDDDRIAAALASAGLATVITAGREGLRVTPLPLLFDSDRRVLVGHMSRANEHWRGLDDAGETVAVYSGVDGYISPSVYATKAKTGKVVPTWNYETINVYGTLRILDDREWLTRHVDALSDRHESGRSEPWSVDDVPDGYIDSQIRGIVGIELAISRWEGKAKMSQNQPEENRESLVARMSQSDDPNDRRVAEAVVTHATHGQ